MGLGEPAGTVTLILGALAATGAALRWLWRASGRLHRLADAILGDQSRGIPGVGERLDRIDQRLNGMDGRLGAVEAQVSPNSGKSLHDKVSRIQDTLAPD